jgi:hypothetical protein
MLINRVDVNKKKAAEREKKGRELIYNVKISWGGEG